MSAGDNAKDWMDELKDGGKPATDNTGGLVGGKAENVGQIGQAPPGWRFSGVFKFQVGEKVYSRIHEAKGIVEYCEFTLFIANDQIVYKIRFNDPEDVKTETSMVEEAWLDKI